MYKGTCSILGCGGDDIVARGWCSPHYERWRRYGTPYGPPIVPIVDLPGERWLPVVDWEGLYEASSVGRLRSLTRPGSGGRGRQRMFQGRLLVQRQATNSEKYLTVTLSRDGKTTVKRVHKLVAAAFLGACPPGLEVCHGPNGALDNSVSNLSYGTHAKNGADTIRDGTSTAGIKNPSAKLTEADVIEIRRRHARGDAGYRVLSREYGVDAGQIRLIVKRRNWRHVALSGAQEAS